MDNLAVGRLGEDEAVQYLIGRGWTILARNYRHGRGEVDIIASGDGVLAFVEVKCRTGVIHGHPLEAITSAKQREIARVARGWLRDHPQTCETLIRFDAVAVVCPNGAPPQVLHVADAWRMG